MRRDCGVANADCELCVGETALVAGAGRRQAESRRWRAQTRAVQGTGGGGGVARVVPSMGTTSGWPGRAARGLRPAGRREEKGRRGRGVGATSEGGETARLGPNHCTPLIHFLNKGSARNRIPISSSHRTSF
jgi:hypothetical protein